jgi:hypothetical protein
MAPAVVVATVFFTCRPRRPDAGSDVLSCSFRATRFDGQNREYNAAPGRALADRDEHPSFSVEALTLTGLIQQQMRNAWLFLIGSESIWDGNVRARSNRG